MSKTLHKSLESKLAMLDGPEWGDSDEEDTDQVVESSKIKKKSSKLSQGNKDNAAEKKLSSATAEASSVIYIGHLPSGFEESELLSFMSQFGNIENLKVSRSKRTGNSRGHAFVQFADGEVATIVAQTMSDYLLMGEKKLVCHVVPKDKIHPHLFRGVSLKSLALRPKKMKGNESLIKYWQEQHREIVNKLDTKERMNKITQRLIEKDKQKRKKLSDLGIDYDFPGYANNGTSKVGGDEGTIDNSTKNHKDKKAKADVQSTSSSAKKRKI